MDDQIDINKELEVLQEQQEGLKTAKEVSEDFQKTYKATSAGILWLKKKWDKKLETWVDDPIKLTNFTAIIRHDVTEDDGADQRRLFEVAGHLRGRDFTCSIPARDYASMGWVLEQIGPQAIIYPGDGLKDRTRAAIQELSDTIQSKTVYRHTGWRKVNGHWYYLHNGGAIGTPAIEPEVVLDSRMAYIELPRPGTIEEQREAVKASLKMLEVFPGDVTLPVFAAVWRAAVGGQIDFSMHVFGETQQGKSELCALAQQFFGPKLDARNFLGSWVSTDNSLEKATFVVKDAIFSIDDYTPRGTSSDISAYKKKAERIFRAAGNKAGRERLNKDLTSRAAWYPRGLILSSGEDIAEGQSVNARIYTVEVPMGQTNWKLLTTCQEDAKNGVYAQAMAGFIGWLSTDYKAKTDEFDNLVKTYRGKFHSEHARFPDIAANLIAALIMFIYYAMEVEGILTSEVRPLVDSMAYYLAEASENSDQVQRDSNEAEVFLENLRGALVSRQAHIENVKNPHEPPEQGDALMMGWQSEEKWDANAKTYVPTLMPKGAHVGWTDGQTVWLHPAATEKAVKRFASERGTPMALSMRSIQKRLHEGGYLLRAGRDGGRRTETIQKKINGVNVNVLAMDIEVMLQGLPEEHILVQFDDDIPPEAFQE